jgi:hypothetical protein
VSIWLEAEVDGRNSGIEGEDGMVGAGAQDLDHVLHALPRLSNTVHSYLDRPKMWSTNFFNVTVICIVPDPDPIRIRRISMDL